jgi:hypothetical protein
LFALQVQAKHGAVGKSLADHVAAHESGASALWAIGHGRDASGPWPARSKLIAGERSRKAAGVRPILFGCVMSAFGHISGLCGYIESYMVYRLHCWYCYHLSGVHQLEGIMRVFGGLFFLACLTGSAWATPVSAPAPEMDAGVLGMTVAVGAIYLMKRFKRS